MELINKTLIINPACNLVTNKNPLLTATLKAKYFPNNSFRTAQTTGSRPVYWSSILQVKHHLHANSTLQIHNGSSSIWSSPWTEHWNQIHDHLTLPVTNQPLPATISDHWLQGSNNWNQQLISNIFHPHMVQTIMNIPVIQSTQPDILRWAPAPSGKCTIAKAYSYLTHLQQHTLPSQGARSISPQVNQTLQKVWKAKSVPPFLKTFAWRLIRRALATADKAGKFSSNID
jgi:hypothetical protein